MQNGIGVYLIKQNAIYFKVSDLILQVVSVLVYLTLLQSTFWFHPTVGGGATMAPWEENGRYLSRLWSNFQNSFLWWKLVKIVTYFYSISNFLSFIVWPLDVAKVTKVCRVNFFEQKIQNFQFWATNMLYTSNESWNYVEFKFITKK